MKPRPSRLNTLSVITAPPTSSAMSSPNIVTIGRQAGAQAVAEDDALALTVPWRAPCG